MRSSQMIKVLITDDEQIVLDGVKFMLEKNFGETLEIVALARSGREAIEKARQTNPHVVFMDIQMPGINGIEAINEIQKLNPTTKFVIISAYEQFDYAQQAVELGVKEYILKPINKNKLMQVTEKLIRELQNESKQKEKEIENIEKLEKVLPILEQGFVYSIMLNNDYRNELAHYKELFDITKENGYIMVLELGDQDRREEIHNKIGSGIKGQKIYEQIRNIIKYKCKSICGPLIINRMVVMSFCEKQNESYDQRVKLIDMAESIVDRVKTLADTQVFVGIGGCYPIEKMNNSYQEAIKALNNIGDQKALHIDDILESDDCQKEYTFMDIKSEQNEILSCVEEGKTHMIQGLIEAYFNRLEKYYPEKIHNLTLEMMIMAKSLTFQMENGFDDWKQQDYLEELKLYSESFEIKNWAVKELIKLSELSKDKKVQHVSAVIFEAKEFIDGNYNKEISLKDVSKEVGISPQYFSKLFKDEIGVNFIEYLTDIRMKEAKKLLKEGRLSVKEICFEIGYNDPNYFSRLFKKSFGVSPTEY